MFIIQSLFITQATHMIEEESIKERLPELMDLEESIFLVDFHQTVEKYRQKAWHDRHITAKSLTKDDLSLLYDSKYLKHLGKLQMHWLGPI